MLDSYFSPYQQFVVLTAFLLYFISIIFFEFSRKQIWAIFFLLVGTLVFKLFVIELDENLNPWDEQFHALVGKNMSENFLVPKLYPVDVLPYDYTKWSENYIWMHKQPIFLMQIALFIKAFGASSFVVRLPSVLCFTASVFCVYKIGKNTLTMRVGYVGAILYSMNYFFSEMMVGLQPTDHNDIVFISYIIGSVWAYTEYLKKRAFKWLIVIIVCSSFAVLTKWLPGYLVFGIWFMNLLQKGLENKNKIEWIDYIKTFFLSLILPALWQIYTYIRFPRETAYEHSFNIRHITEPLDGHAGDVHYYLDNLSITIGYYAPFFVVAGLILMGKYIKDRKMYFSFLFIICVVFIFFTITSTKMRGFTCIVYFIIFLGFGAILEEFYYNFRLNSKKIKRIISCLFLFYCTILIGNLEGLQRYHTSWVKNEWGLQNFRIHNLQWLQTCRQINKELTDGKYVIFNCEKNEAVKLMFYTNQIGYDFVPNDFQINLSRIKGYKIAIIDNGMLPPSIINNKDIRVIKNLNDRIVSIDTVLMKLNEKEFLSITPEGKLALTPDNPSKIICTTFADGHAQLKSVAGKIATSRLDEGGLVVFERDTYGIYEQFVLKKENKKYAIRTIFDEDLVIPPNETNFYTKRHQNKHLIVEFIPCK